MSLLKQTVRTLHSKHSNQALKLFLKQETQLAATKEESVSKPEALKLQATDEDDPVQVRNSPNLSILHCIL